MLFAPYYVLRTYLHTACVDTRYKKYLVFIIHAILYSVISIHAIQYSCHAATVHHNKVKQMIVLNSQLQSHLQESNRIHEDERVDEPEHEPNDPFTFQHSRRNEPEVNQASSLVAQHAHATEHHKDDNPSFRSLACQERTAMCSIITGLIGFMVGKAATFKDLPPSCTSFVFLQSNDSWLGSASSICICICIMVCICIFISIYISIYSLPTVLSLGLDHSHPSPIRCRKIPSARSSASEDDGKDDNHPPSNDKDMSEWRHRIIAALGSIHAPPPTITLHTDKPHHQPNQIISTQLRWKFLTLLENHVGACIAIDEALQIMRMVSSIQLGLGPLSPSLERVERSKNIKRARGGALAASGSSRVMHGMRQVLMQSLKKQHGDLQMIMEELTNHDLRSEGGGDGLGSDGDRDHDHYYEEMDAISGEMGAAFYTIAMLKSCAVENKDMLSKVLSLVMVGVGAGVGVGHNNGNSEHSQCSVEYLDSSCRLAEELEIYIRSYFDLKPSNSNSNLATDDTNGMPVAVKVTKDNQHLTSTIYCRKMLYRWKML